MEKTQKHLNKYTAGSIALLKVIDSNCHLKDSFDIKCVHTIFTVILTYLEISARNICILYNLKLNPEEFTWERKIQIVLGSMLHK